MVYSKYTIREQNEATILNYIIKNKEISRAKLAEISSLNKASVSSIVKKLIDEQFILETKIGESSESGGRKPILLTFNQTTALLIGIDLGDNYIDALLSYIDGTEITRIQLKNSTIHAKNVETIIHTIITECEKQAPQTPHGIVGLTIGIHGQVFKEMIRFTPYYDLENINLTQRLNDRYEFPVYLENEANLSALGEYTFSSDYESLVTISLHRGIGAGIVKQGKLTIGYQGNAGEIGHTILIPNGRQCPCGNKGCLEQYCSMKIICDEIKEKKKWHDFNMDRLVQAYHDNDALLVSQIEKYAELLAIGINNIIAINAPQLVIFNSSLTQALPEMVALIKKQLTNRFSKDVVIMNSATTWNPAIYGALAYSAQRFLNIKQLKLIDWK